jgi:glycosyltransferase involved in cell wall biosynthesis
VSSTAPVRLGIDATATAPGGGLVVLVGYLRAWKALGVPMEIRVYGSHPSVLEEVRAIGGPVRAIPFASDCGRLRRLVLQRTTLGPRMAADGVEIILGNNVLVGRTDVRQVVLHINLKHFLPFRLGDTPLREAPTAVLRKRASRRALRRAWRNVFVSSYLRARGEELVPSSSARNYVIHQGLDDRWDSARYPPVQPRPHTLFSATSSAPHKDGGSLIGMMAHLAELQPGSPWTLRIAGAGDFRAERALATELGVAERVAWLGYLDVPALRQEYASAAVSVFASPVEAFGNGPLEAMASGCPVVACDATAIPEVVGDAAVLVPPRSPRALAAAVMRVVDNPALATELIEKGRLRASGFSWNRLAAELFALLAEARPADRAPR